MVCGWTSVQVDWANDFIESYVFNTIKEIKYDFARSDEMLNCVNKAKCNL